MSLFRPPLRFWTFSLIAALLVAGLVFYVASDPAGGWQWPLPAMLAKMLAADPDLRREVVKLGLQFLLVTLFGGIVLAFVNARKDQDAREQQKDAAVRDMVRHVLAVHGKLKAVKRRLRSRIVGHCEPGNRKRRPPYRIAASDFEKAMEDLLAAQIEAEHVRDSVRARDDLLSGRRIERLHRALDYAARYYHDVYLEYEDCVVRRSEGHYEVTDACPNLADFLGRSAWANGDPDHVAELDARFRVLGDELAPIEERYAALDHFARAFDAGAARRHRIVATLAIVLASADLQRSVRRQRWLGFARQAMARAEAELEAKEAAAAAKPG